MSYRAIVFALVLGAGACSQSEKERAAVDAPAVPAAQAPAPTVGTDSPAAPAEPAVAVALDGEGLRLVDSKTGSTRLLAFGADSAAALQALTTAWGAPAERAAQPDCGAGPLTSIRWPNGLTVLVQEAKFTGWSATAPRQPVPAGRAVQTMSGVGAGSTRGEVEGAYAINVSKTTLGTEFQAGAMSGVFADSTPGAPVEVLWAGMSCVYR
ncbi:hypothetical protein [Longimicrobium terrae]|uniref:Uncharacterized protein n=1 Tax=Longimicrobium terrae TaxID=1639882 RepID=A0A841H1U1_9BACT|nr:hypothetical protein [Longimicrobium terrae]MBB4637590.1 hypothetical protein [Longimicrobium terrae]MBB6071987.1 hypothetical protein [Longimicrobium terrae]NNC29925.1 hypothetical protein [Longimicrobium terrae]